MDRLTLSLLAAVLATGCSAAPPGPEHRFEVIVEDGVEVALTTGGPKYDGEIFEYEQLVIVRPDPEVEESFLYSPQWMTTSDDGRVFIGDMGDNQVVVYGPDGDYRYRFGREGQGPGEYRILVWVDVDDDVVWVTDHPFRKHAFELDGTLIETVTLPDTARSLLRDGRWWRLADGRFVIFTLQRRADRYSEETAEMHVVDAEGTAQATVTMPWVITGEYGESDEAGRREYYEYFFVGRPWGDFSPELGIFLSNPLEPEILVYDDEGALRKRYRVEQPDEPITTADQEHVRDLMQRRLEGVESGEIGNPRSLEINLRAARSALENPRFPERKHHFERPLIDDRGFLWMLLPEPRDYIDRVYRYAVFSPEGEYLGITTPPGQPQPSRGKLLSKWTDPETGEEYPVVYRIRPAVEGLIY